MKQQSQYIENVRTVERRERDVQELQSQREQHSRHILELQKLLTEKDGAVAERELKIQDSIRSNDEAIAIQAQLQSQKGQHARETKKLLT